LEKKEDPAMFGYAFSRRQKTIRGKHDVNGRNKFDLKAAATDGFEAFAKGA